MAHDAPRRSAPSPQPPDWSVPKGTVSIVTLMFFSFCFGIMFGAVIIAAILVYDNEAYFMGTN